MMSSMRSSFLIALLYAVYAIAQVSATGMPAHRTTQNVVSTRFGDDGLAYANVAESTLRGQLPKPWFNFTGDAAVTASTQPLREGHTPFQHVEITKQQNRPLRIAYPLPDADANAVYTLSITVRGTPDAGLIFGVAGHEAPHKTVYDSYTPMRATWRTVTFRFIPTASLQRSVLYVGLGRTGFFDLAHVSLAKTPIANVVENLRRQHPHGTARNLVRNSVFPLGLQSGWWLDLLFGETGPSVAAEPKVHSDAALPGPSGLPSLHLKAPRQLRLTSAPIGVPLPIDKHVASFYARGKGSLTLVIQADDNDLTRQTFSLFPDRWQRYQLAFKPKLLAKAYKLNFEFEPGAYWLDAVQVAQGSTAGAYTSHMVCEVSLSNDAPSGISSVQFAEESPSLRWAVASPQNNVGVRAVLKAAVVNIYGERRSLTSVPLSTQKLQNGRMTYPLFAKHPLGVYRIEAWVEDAKGKRLSPVSEIVLNRIRRPRYWGKDAPQSPFGVHVLPNTHDMMMAKSLGINWVRLHDAGMTLTWWNFLEPQKGKWEFRDAEIARYRRNGLKILGALSTTPPWARPVAKTHDAYIDRFYVPKDLADYANYVKTVTARYRGVIDAWEVWNEPWFGRLFWHSDYDGDYKVPPDSQAGYARMMEAAFHAARSSDPTAKIVGINTTTHEAEAHFIDGTVWTRGVLQNGGLQWCDVVSYHHYMGGDSGYTGDAVEKGHYKALSPLLQQPGGLTKPVWMSEGSSLYGTDKHSGFYAHSLPSPNTDNNTEVANRLCRFTMSLLAQNVKKVFLYGMHTRTAIWAVLVNSDNSLNPSAAAYSNLTWQLEDTQFNKRIELAQGVFAYLFHGKGRAVAVIAPRNGAAFALPRLATFQTADLWGNALPVGSRVTSTLTYVSMPGTASMLERALRSKSA